MVSLVSGEVSTVNRKIICGSKISKEIVVRGWIMLKFWPGIILLQLVTLVLFYLMSELELEIDLGASQLWLTIGLVELLFSVLAAFWFASIARQCHQDELETVKEEHAQEREKIRVNAERAKTRIVNKSHKEMLKETRRAHAGANIKVGAAFAGALALGGIMISTQFVTFGLLLLTTAGGGLAGYLARGRQMALLGNKGGAGRLSFKNIGKKPPEKLE